MKSSLASFRITSPRRQEGMALIVTLALIVLVTVAVVAFLTRATGNRTIEASRSNQVLSEQLAKTGADYTISSFLNEIAIHSTLSSGGTLLPQAPSYMIPQRVFAAGNAGATSPASSSFPQFANLVRQSVSDPILETNASADSTTLPSQNGASVDVAQWSLPDLITGGFTAANQLPNWIYVNKDGSFTNTLTAQNASNVIGRFAYNAYDIGGLLDANVAGYDNTSGIGTNASGLPFLSQIKGTLAGADLSILPGFSSMSAFVQQRNPASYGSPETYINAIRSAATNGFMTPSAGDLHFTTRQDLIRAAESGAFGFETNSLPYLTHFTRELARPSLAGFSTMPARFDLGSLISNVAIKPNLFGLKSSLANVYEWQSATTATTNDFFSVLYKADTVISQGSGSSTQLFYPGPFGNLGSTNWTDDTDFHARGLGMNIIDQFNGATADPDLIVAPAVNGSANNIDQPGKKGLPYLSRVNVLYNISGAFPTYNFTFGIIPEVSVPPGGSDQIGTLCATNTGITVGVTVTAYDGTTGKALANALGIPLPTASTAIVIPKPTNNIYNVTFQNGVSTSRNWTNYILFDALINPSPTTPMSLTNGFFPTKPVLIVLPPTAAAAPPIKNPVYGFNVSISISKLCFALSSQKNNIWYNEFGQDPGSQLTVANPTDPLASAPLTIAYNGTIYAFQNNATTPIPNLGNPAVIVASTAPPNSNQVSGVTVYADDPRTIRNAGGIFDLPTDTTMPDFNAGSLSSDLVTLGLPDPVPIVVPYASSITDTEYWPTTNQINGVGELGEVFHEAPWRTIDFVSGTSASADYPLLDLFSAFSTPPSGVRAGVLNLNTRQPLVLQSVLQGTPTSPSKTSFISEANASTIAAEIIAMTNPDPNNPTAQPWTNRVQLIDLVQTNIANNQSAFQLEKTHHESIVRALGEVGQTRTWNLLIDVVAQAGHFSPNSLSAGASPSGSQFIVGGQDRIWVSTAIDRFTGQVVDRQVEQVK